MWLSPDPGEAKGISLPHLERYFLAHLGLAGVEKVDGAHLNLNKEPTTKRYDRSPHRSQGAEAPIGSRR